MKPLMWFRADLRVRDNTALHHACRRADGPVVAVFTICPKQWKEHDWGDARVDFLRRNLECLSDELKKRNVPLRIVETDTFDGVPAALDRLAQSHGCDALYFNREYEANERKRDRAVTELFMRRGRAVHAFTDQVVLAPGSVMTAGGEWFKVFTPFRKAWLASCRETGPPEPLGLPRRPPAGDVEPDAVAGSVQGFGAPPFAPDLWPAGEAHAGRRLSAFIDRRIAEYHERRDLPAVNGTSTLSPYLACGVISPRQCLAAAREANGGRLSSGEDRRSGPSIWITELIWREFYKHLLVGFPRVSMNRPFRRETAGIRWSYSKKNFAAWCEGRTGYPIVDAAMRALNGTGWMHNRLRMITAMFLTKDLFIDWRWGERYFMQRLVDGDLASNNGGWQWSASTGTDAAPYFRIFNPTTQGRRYDPDASFITRHVPELDGLDPDEVHEPAGPQREHRGYPPPICDHARARQRAIEAFKKL